MSEQNAGQTPAPATPPVEGLSNQELDAMLDGDLPAQDVFPRDYVEKLRGEAKARRLQAKQYEELGDIDTLKKGKQWVEASSTSEGLARIWWDVSRALGFPDEDLDSFVQGSQKPATPISPDGALDEATEIKVTSRIDHLEQQLAAEREERIFVERQKAVNAALDSLKVNGQEARQAVLAMGNEFVPDLDTASIAQIVEAVQKGHEKYKATIEQEVEAYIKSKQQDQTGTPQALTGGGSVTGSNPPPPKSVKEAGERARARLKALGRL